MFTESWFQQNQKNSNHWSCFGVKSSKKKVNHKLDGYHIFLGDGTEVEDEEYFQMLPAQSVLIVSEGPKLNNSFTHYGKFS